MDKYIIGIDIGGTNFRIGMIRSDGTLKNFIRTKSSILQNNDNQSLIKLEDYIENYIGKYLDGKLLAISVGFPSTVSKDKKTVLQTPNIKGFDNINVADPLSQRFNVPVYVTKDVHSLLLFDIMKFKLDPNLTIIGFYVGTGFGNSIYLNGSFLYGKNGVAGELGHIPTFDMSRQCGCGNKGCIELFAGGKNLVNIQEKYFGDLDISKIFTIHSNHEIILEYINYISLPIATEINIFDPDCVVIGGGIIEMENFPIARLEEDIRFHVRKPYPANNLKIIYSNHNQKAGVLGAAYYGFKELKLEVGKKKVQLVI